MVSVDDVITPFIEQADDDLQVIGIDQLPFFNAGPLSSAPTYFGNFDGDKFFEGFGATNLQMVDYWTLRARSAQLFNENLYARGLIRRLVTNEINTGLHPEPSPDESIIGVPAESLDLWCEDTENRFFLWGETPWLCDYAEQNSWGSLQQTIRAESLIEGDILVVLRMSQATGLPMVQLISGSLVQSPIGTLADQSVCHGVKRDERGRHVGYYVTQEDGSSKFLPAWGEKSGRRLAWLVYGTDKRKDDVRGQPLLSLILQSLKEVDRYRDAVQRKAVINSMLAMFIKKTEDKPGTLPIQGGAVRKDAYTVTDNTGGARGFNITKHVPGMVIQELQKGEEPVGFHSQGIDIAFGPFEEAMIQAIAWANQIPPEILTLAFSSNYSASQAAINEFKIYLNLIRDYFSKQVCQPIYVEWLVSSVLMQSIRAPQLIESWRDMTRHAEFTAWTCCDWAGAIKPSTDIRKQAQGYQLMVQEGWVTNGRASRELMGMNYSKVIKQLRRENEQKVEAMRPLAEFQQKYGIDLSKTTGSDLVAAVEAIMEEREAES